MDDQEIISSPQTEVLKQNEVPDILTESMQQVVAQIQTHDTAAGREITQAEQSGALSGEAVQEMHDRRKGCLIQVMNALSRAVPERFKPRLQAALARNEILERSYIVSIDPIEQQEELIRLRQHYEEMVITALSIGDDPRQLSRAIGRFVDCLEQAGYDNGASADLTGMIYRLSFMGQSEAITPSARSEAAYVLAETAIASGNADLATNAVQQYLESFDDNPGRLLSRFSPEEAEKIAYQVIQDKAYSLYSRGSYVFDILESLPPEKRRRIVELAAQRVQWHNDKSVSDQDRVDIGKRLLAVAEDDQRQDILDALTPSNYNNIIKTTNTTEQIHLIQQLTTFQDQQDRLFEAIRIEDGDYRNIESFDIEAYISRLTYTSRNTSFVYSQYQAGSISAEAYRTYGNRHILEELSDNTPSKYQLEHIVALHERYGVPLTQFPDQMRHAAEHVFSQGTIDRQVHRLLQKIGTIEMTSAWEPFSHDMQTTERLGERTWRDEQPLIDILQNHLDANDMKCALDLASRIFGRPAVIDMLERSNYDISRALGDMLEHKKRMSSNESARFMPKDVPQTSLTEYEDAVAEVPYAAPLVEIYMESPTGEHHWISYDELRYFHPTEGKIKGVRFTDNGLGYDEQLNALFAPTKGEYPFLRGHFGQGAKLSMARLLAAGCHITTTSSCQILESGERIEWEGSPTYSKDTNTLHFSGRKRRVYNTSADTQSGTSTEIMFGNADTHAVRVFTHMLETRRGEPGLGRYVFDYLPGEIRASYKDAKPYTERYSPSDWVRVSQEPGQRGMIYVQGLEVPTRSLHLGFSYDFKDKSIFTGADRAWLENDKVKSEIVHAWACIDDPQLVRSFHDMLMGDNGLYNETYWVNSLQYTLRKDAKKAHELLLTQRFGLKENTRGVVFATRSEMQQYAEHTQQLANAGYIIYPVTIVSQEAVSFFQYVFGEKYKMVGMETGITMIDTLTQESIQTNEAIEAELKTILAETRAGVDTYLRQAGLVAAADLLASMKIEISLSASDKNKEVYILRSYNRQTMSQDGVCIKLTPLAFNPSEMPETLEGANHTYTRFLTEMCLLSIAGGGSETGIRGNLLGQEVVNQLLDASVSAELSTAASDIRIDYEEPQQSIESVRETIRADERLTTFQSALRILLDKKADVASIRQAADKINDMCAIDPVPEAVRPLMYSISGSFCFDGTRMYTLVTRPSEDSSGPRGIDVFEVNTEQIGQMNGIPLYVGNRDSYHGTVLLMPIDFSTRSSVTLSDGRNKRIVSAYDEVHAPPDLRDDPTGKCSTEKFFSDLALSHAYVSNGVIAFPIGAYDRELVEQRIAYARDHYKLSVESGGAVLNDEFNHGKEYIETTLSDEYGEGKAWDNPIRIFGDIAQNHIDEGGADVEMMFEITTNRRREWISATELKEPHHADSKISGVRFSDNGRGYTTRQLTVLSESTKNGQGQRGKFGTGLKMLTASCVRQGFELRFSSRNWTATASSRRREIIQHGVPRQKNIVGFDMDWQENPGQGSYTEVRLPEGHERQGTHVWHAWMQTVDPRITDNRGNTGLERYVRAMRKRRDGIRIGKVTILPNEPGAFFEGGILIPSAEGRTGKKYLFGYDVDDDIVATQERDVIDPAKLRPLMAAAFKDLPPELCKIMIQQTFALNTESSADVPEEYTLIEQLQNIAALRLAYYNRFGESALLSSAAAAKNKLKYGYGEYALPLSEKEQAILMSVIEAEQTSFDASQVIRLRGKAGANIANILEPHVHTTLGVMVRKSESFTEVMDIPGDASERLQRMVQIAAKEMADTLNRVYESDNGEILSRLLHASNKRYIYNVGDPTEAYSSPEAIIAYYESLAQGLRTLNLRVSPLRGAHAFVHDANGITFGARSLQEANLTGGTAKHEISHLATNLRDYNTAFLGMLMLAVPAIANRYST